MAHGYRKGGWRNKYFVAKWDHDSSGEANGIKFTDPNALYFVMRYDKDPHARIAMRAYAESIKDENWGFSRDILQKLADSSNTEGAALENVLQASNDV